MKLPYSLQEKVNELYGLLNKQALVSSRQGLTQRYKATKESGKSLIDSKNDSLVYAISRMPATYSVIYTLLESLMKQGLIFEPEIIFDIGSGTGAGYFACKELFENANISLFERDLKMIEVFKKLEENVPVTRFDIVSDEIKEKADLVLTSYVLSEMNEESRINAVKKMLDATNKYVLLIDTGTPRTYENFLKIKKMALSSGWNVLAPCGTQDCGLKNDYCQFYVRVERSSLQKLSKNASLPYEDEKYFYLLLSKEQIECLDDRVIRRPIIKTNVTELKTCGNQGVRQVLITKKNKELYKLSKKVKINELINLDELG